MVCNGKRRLSERAPNALIHAIVGIATPHYVIGGSRIQRISGKRQGDSDNRQGCVGDCQLHTGFGVFNGLRTFTQYSFGE